MLFKSSRRSFLLFGQLGHLWGISVIVNCLFHFVFPNTFLYICEIMSLMIVRTSSYQWSLIFNCFPIKCYCLTLILLLSIISCYISDSLSRKCKNCNKEWWEKYILINIYIPFKNQMLVTIIRGRDYHFMYFLILAILNHNTNLYSLKKYIKREKAAAAWLAWMKCDVTNECHLLQAASEMAQWPGMF